ncbi:MAG: fibronectin type III domain-containing protein, partial [Acidobacteriota bacterium]|nr:fibronectin type III domain-containing protein [Acidobacteriota bacterium]
PINLQASLNGTSVALSWAAGSGGGAPLGVLLEAGTASGAADLGAIPLPLSTQLTVPGVTPGVYFVRVYAVNGSGRSRPSNEVRIEMPGGGGCTTPASPSLTASVSGRTVSFAWTAVAGIASYRLEVSTGPSGPIVLSQPFAPATTTVSYPNAPAGTYYARVVAVSGCGAQAASATSSFTVDAAPPGGRRTPDPPPGQRLPLPDMSSVVNAVGDAYRGDLRNSCRDTGGNNVWLFRLVEELRRYDTRWGLNWKRGNVGDMSQDIVNYNFSADADEGTTNVYIIDVIGGHCGGNPQPAWIDVTEATRNGGTIGRWTLQPYIAAGGQP